MRYHEVTNVARNRFDAERRRKVCYVGSVSVSHMSSQYRCETLATGSSPCTVYPFSSWDPGRILMTRAGISAATANTETRVRGDAAVFQRIESHRLVKEPGSGLCLIARPMLRKSGSIHRCRTDPAKVDFRANEQHCGSEERHQNVRQSDAIDREKRHEY